MLGLKLPTDPRWVNLAEKSLGEILTDHCYCELKAATQCITLIQAYPDKIRLVQDLAPIVTEEWSHFRMVLAQIKRRGLKLGEQRRDQYVGALRKHIVKGGSKEDRLLDHLLIAALIEARSCERFRLLSEGLQDQDLAQFYQTLLASEAGHYRLFKDLAVEYLPKERVDKRWQEFLDYESEIMSWLTIRGDRVH